MKQVLGPSFSVTTAMHTFCNEALQLGVLRKAAFPLLVLEEPSHLLRTALLCYNGLQASSTVHVAL
jgi:hypothetical protein